MVSLKELYQYATPVQGKKGILRSIHTTLKNGVPVKVVFVQNRNKKSEWLAILSTDCTLIRTRNRTHLWNALGY